MEVNLVDLVQNKDVYVYLKRNYRLKLFSKLLAKFKTKKLIAQKLGIKNSNYILAYGRGSYACPLYILNKMTILIGEKLEFLESNITLIKTHGGKGIKNPKFPIKLDENLAKIFGNLIGDGCITYHKKSLRVYYTNLDSILINEFKKAVRQCFGDIHIGVCDNQLVYLPKIVGLILVRFKCKTNSLIAEIPKFILNSNNKIKSVFLRALFEDDGSVVYFSKNFTRTINLTSGSLKLAKQVKNLLLEFNINSSLLNDKRNNLSIVSINGRENLINFKDNINFSKGYYKQILLDKMIKSYVLITTKHEKYKELIINLLKKENCLRTEEISDKLGMTKRNIFGHLKLLKSSGIVNFKYNKPIRLRNGTVKNNLCYSWYLINKKNVCF